MLFCVLYLKNKNYVFFIFYNCKQVSKEIARRFPYIVLTAEEIGQILGGN